MQQPKSRSGRPRPDNSLEARRLRRRGLRLAVFIFLIFCLAIVIGVLTSDKQRRMHALIARIAEFLPGQTDEEAEPTLLRGKRLTTTKVLVPARFFESPRLLDVAAPVRQFRVSGQTLCSDIKAAGIGTSEWVQNPFSPDIFNCIAETTLPATKPDGDAPSFFMVVRGNADGRITQIRLKVIEVKSSREIWQRYDAALDLILKASRWPDFAAEFDRLRSLDPFDANHFGIGLKMTREFMGPERYNIIFMPEDDGELQRRTRAQLDARQSLKQAPLLAKLWPRQNLGIRR